MKAASCICVLVQWKTVCMHEYITLKNKHHAVLFYELHDYWQCTIDTAEQNQSLPQRFNGSGHRPQGYAAPSDILSS